MRSILFAGCAALALSTGSAVAQESAEGVAVDEVVVTAQKRSENLQDVPVSVTAFSGQSLTDRGVTNVIGLNNLAPGLRVSSGDAAANPKIFIRGVGLSDFNPNSSSGVGIYVDGVYVSSPLAQMAGFFDIGQIEILRGPQGTLYGRNTNGGAVNLTTRRPTQAFTAEAAAEYATYDAVNLTGAVGGGVIPGVLAVRAAGQLVDDGGYAYNRVTGNDLNETRYWALRLSALYTPTETIEALFQVNRFANRGDATQPQHRALFPLTPGATGSDGFCTPAFYGTAQCSDAFGYVDTDGEDRALDANSEGKDKIDLFGASAHITWELGQVSLVSVTAWSWAHRNAFENTDANPYQMLEINYLARQRQFTQELRLQSNDPDARLKWVLGAYYMDETVKDASTQDVLRDLRPFFPDGFSLADSVAAFSYPYTQSTKSYAAFGQADYQVTDRLTATVGLRYSADDKSFDYRSQAEGGLIVLLTSQQNKTFSAWSGRLGLRYEVSDDVGVYATYNRGFKSGGFFGGLATTPEELIPYDNETLDAFEIGLKSELLERRLRLNLSAFYYDYQDQQVFAQALRNGLTVLVLDNAANSEVYGAEIEATAKITRNLSIDAGLALLDATYGEYVSQGDDFSGNRLPQSPKLTFNMAANYSHPLPAGGELLGTVDAAYSSKVYFDNSNADRLSQDGVWVVGAQAGWRSTDGRIEAGVFARNLFDETYVVSISNIDSLGEDLLGLNRPRSLGAFLRYRY
ncbi:TonB-dependent receptor [Phenylobacterium sp.]|uniref:TonB-dependent receptor n=1 Tax=Phenylobacterium sp. TaxID=1871053 RepID=UPI002FC5F922